MPLSAMAVGQGMALARRAKANLFALGQREERRKAKFFHVGA